MNRHLPLIGGFAAGTVVACALMCPPPPGFLTFEYSAFMAAAAAYAVVGERMAPAWWAWPRPIRGVGLIGLGLVLAYVPFRFVASAILLGHGARMLLASAATDASKAKPETWPARVPGRGVTIQRDCESRSTP